MSSWVSAEEYAKATGKSIEEVITQCTSGRVGSKEEDGRLLVELGSELILAQQSIDIEGGTIDRSFIEKTLGTIMGLHDKVLEAKDETLEALRRENKFLKEGLLSMQEIYEADKKTIETLTEQLKVAQEELEFTKRKYKLMWGQVVEKHSQTN